MYNFEGKFITENITPLNSVSQNDTKIAIYEVIRIIDGIPLFLIEHLDRLQFSCERKNIILNKNNIELVELVKKTISINSYQNKNIQILIQSDGNSSKLTIGFIHSNYPDKHLYKTGIHIILYAGERKNPNIKQHDFHFREKIAEQLAKHHATEAFLVNNENMITEGSRCNVFFIQGNYIITQKSNTVLKGITREKVIEICKNQNIKLTERAISVQELTSYDAIFITGTSVDIMPVASINQYNYASSENLLVKKIQEKYSQCKEENLKLYKESFKCSS